MDQYFPARIFFQLGKKPNKIFFYWMVKLDRDVVMAPSECMLPKPTELIFPRNFLIFCVGFQVMMGPPTTNRSNPSSSPGLTLSTCTDRAPFPN